MTGQGTREEILSLVNKHGLDMMMVRSGGEVQVFAPRSDRGHAVLFESDARAIEAEVPGIEMLSVTQSQRDIEIVAGDRVHATRIFGVEPPWIEVRRWSIAEGEFISEQDMTGVSRVAILGVAVADALFPDGGAVGSTIRIANDPFTVKGVFTPMGANAAGDDWDDRIVVPFTTSSRRLFGRPYLEQIVIRVRNVREMPETAERVRELLRVRHDIGPGDADDFFVREPDDVESAALETSSTLTALLIATSIVALVAGGIVIMNLMLLAVAQRVHEIGVRRAVGARASDISRHFLLESLFIAVAGAIIGVAAGTVVALTLSAVGIANTRITVLPFAVSFAACILIGVGFGLQPARRAARVDPATTLREQRI
jgi:putative ABC transport system permease protein